MSTKKKIVPTYSKKVKEDLQELKNVKPNQDIESLDMGYTVQEMVREMPPTDFQLAVLKGIMGATQYTKEETLGETVDQMSLSVQQELEELYEDDLVVNSEIVGSPYDTHVLIISFSVFRAYGTYVTSFGWHGRVEPGFYYDNKAEITVPFREWKYRDKIDWNPYGIKL